MFLKAICVLVLCFGLIGSYSCSSPDEKANKLFVEASQLVEQAQIAEETSYSNAYKLYEKAQKSLDTITKKYPTSNVAVGISQGDTRIGEYTITEFKNKILVEAKLKSDAEEDPLACALFLASTMDDKDVKKPIVLSYIARVEAHINIDNALKLSSESLKLANKFNETDLGKIFENITAVYSKGRNYEQAFQLAEGIHDQYYKVISLATIAGYYGQEGQREKAVEVLYRALVELRNNKDKLDESQTDDLLAFIAGYESKIGQYQEALNIANTIHDPITKAQALAWIAESYSITGQNDQASEISYQAYLISKNDDSADQNIYIAWLYATIANNYIRIGLLDKANEILSQASTLAKSTNNDRDFIHHQPTSMAYIAGVYNKAKRKDKSIGLLNQALQLTDKDQKKEYKAYRRSLILIGYWYYPYFFEGYDKPNLGQREKIILREIVRSADLENKSNEQ